MNPIPRHDTWADGIGAGLRGHGTGYVAPRYEQGRWFARLAVKLLLGAGVIVAVATLVHLTVAMFQGVQA